MRSSAALVGIGLFCFYFSIFTFQYWKFNFIEITSEELFVSVLDRTTPRIWPRFDKESIRLDDIEAVSLERPTKIYSAPKLTINRKNNKTYYVDTKPFSKADFIKLFEEFEKKGIAVEITIGAI